MRPIWLVRWLFKYRPWWLRDEDEAADDLAKAQAQLAAIEARLVMLERMRELSGRTDP